MNWKYSKQELLNLKMLTLNKESISKNVCKLSQHCRQLMIKKLLSIKALLDNCRFHLNNNRIMNKHKLLRFSSSNRK